MKIILSDNLVIAIRDNNFTLAPTDTDVSIMSWDGEEPVLGSVYNGSGFVPLWQSLDNDSKLQQIRARREALLLSNDFMVNRHIEQETRAIPTSLSSAQYNELLAYRQALRDITSTADLSADSIELIAWPTKPSFI